jgi:hypothetical protein
MPHLGSLTRVLARTRHRVRVQHALNAFTGALLGWLVCAVSYAVWAFWTRHGRILPLESIVLLIAAACLGALWPVSLDQAARRIDVTHALHDRFRAALDFASRPAQQRSRFMEAAIQDAIGWVARISVARAAPIALPRNARWAALGLAIFVGLVVFPARQPLEPNATTATKPRQESLLSADDAEAFRSDLAQLTQEQPLSEQLRDEALRYQQLLDHLMRNDLGRIEAIRQLLALEKQLAAQQPEAHASGELGEFSRTLAGANEMLRKALESQNAEAVAAELARLAKAARSGDTSDLQKIRQSLRELASKRASNEARQTRAKELESLLKRKQEAKPTEPEEKRLLERQRRELEKLQRELAEQRQQNRQLDKLERDLADLSRALDENDLQRAEQQLSEASKDTQRFGDEQREQEQREELSRQVSQLRQLMQQGGQQGDGDDPPEQAEPQGESKDGDDRQQQASLEQKFLMRARGKADEGEAKREGAQAQGQSQEEGAAGEQEGSSGGERGGARLLELQPTRRGEGTLLIPGAERRAEVGARSDSPSREHDERTADQATSLDGTTRDSRLTGSASKGPSRSQTILDAADRGFATTDYRKVYTDYHGHAEQVLEQDDVPAGYRFYVRRYFQLIRPRDPER